MKSIASRNSTVLLVGLLLAPCALANEGPEVRRDDIFVSGTEGYHSFRIPSLLVTKKGEVGQRGGSKRRVTSIFSVKA